MGREGAAGIKPRLPAADTAQARASAPRNARTTADPTGGSADGRASAAFLTRVVVAHGLPGQTCFQMLTGKKRRRILIDSCHFSDQLP